MFESAKSFSGRLRPSGIVSAVTAAVLFGASTPLSKLIVGRMDPVLLAGLLYLGSGSGLTLWWLAGRRLNRRMSREADLKLNDLPWLAGAILTGGVAGPVLLMLGLKTTPAASASLLLNLEGVFTATLAWFAFKENFDRGILAGMAAITAGCAVLSWSGGEMSFISWGALAVIAACLAWGIDNNLTRRVSAGDPLQIAAAKGLVAGSVSLVAALLMGAELPEPEMILAASVVGLFGYGISLVLFVLSLRRLGTARTGAYFSVAPFVGAAFSIVFLKENVTVPFLIGASLMAIGVLLHLAECHGHEHSHDAMEHEHNHLHDEHHEHDHEESVLPREAHSHPHEHCELLHSHPHYPDIHHRHGH